MMIRNIKPWVVVLAALVMGFGLSSISFATVHSNPVCMRCHTMHYSEDGGAPEKSTGGFGMDAGDIGGAPGPYPYLLLRSGSNLCLGCHANETGGIVGDYAPSGEEAPCVYNTGGVDTHPAGDFKNADADDAGDQANGHNPGGELGEDTVFSSTGTTPGAPGGNFHPGGSGGSHDRYATADFTCTSCHAPHGITGAGTTYNNPDNVFAYKLLRKEVYSYTVSTAVEATDGDLAVNVDPEGTGGDYEYTSPESGTNRPTYKANMSRWCGGCHGAFHSAATGDGDTGYGNEASTSGHWLRHPTDTQLGSDISDNYTDAYSTDFPLEVGSDGVLGADTASEKVFCMSCHRAHATPSANAMRWDATTPSGYKAGCNKCHDKG